VIFVDAKRYAHDEWLVTLRDPQNKLIQAELSETGGLTGASRGSGVIRRWTAPLAGVIRIHGSFARERGKPAGSAQALIVQTHADAPPQILGRFDSDGMKMPTMIRRLAVQRGDFVDFIVMSTSEKQEAFQWAPVIDLDESTAPEPLEGRHQWNAQADFAGPQPPAPKGLLPWEKYVQVLLLTNELAFVN
jgi:hypothetical protein